VIDIEHTEAFLPIQTLIDQVVFISWTLIGLILIIVFFIASSISEPIEKLTQIIAPISKNNFNVKIDKKILKLKDEIGQLARSFNAMIKKLKTSYGGLENKIEKRNQELEKMNKFFLNREGKIIELKEKIEKLKKK